MVATSAGPALAISILLSTLVTETLARQCNQPITFPGAKIAPGYAVKFIDEKYSIAQHLRKIGRNFATEEIPFIGYTAALTKDDITAVCTDPKVDFIQQNTFGTYHGPIDTGLLTRRAATSNAGYALTYLSEKTKNPTDNKFYYPDNAGAGVDIYIVDSGINRITPSPFGSRLQDGVDFSGKGFQDDGGHGTSVAACAGSDKYGTANAATIWNYKIDSGGIPLTEYAERAIGRIVTVAAGRKGKSKGAVINISSALTNTAILEAQIDRAIKAGITVVVSAGNNNIDSSRTAPCMYPGVICVGAINDKYEQSTFSNWGKALTLYAPGEQVDSIDKNGKPIKKNGSSFASPYVAGIAATFYGVEGPAMNPARVRTLLKQNAEKGIISGVKGGGPNLLANNGKQKASNNLPYDGAPVPSPAPAPASTSTPAPAPAASRATSRAP